MTFTQKIKDIEKKYKVLVYIDCGQYVRLSCLPMNTHARSCHIFYVKKGE